MKSKIKFLIILWMAGLTFQSCLFQEEDIFDKSSSERLTEALENFHTTIQESPYGWKLAYDCSETSCYRFFMKFYGGDTVAILSDIKTAWNSTPAISTYSLKQSQGPVLAFNTYNEQLHFLAEPNNSGATKGGDNDFVIMKVTPDSIVLKGIKGQKKIVMHRADETDEAGYFINNTRFKNLFAKSSSSPFFSKLTFSDSVAVSFRTESNTRYITFLYKNEKDSLITNRLSYDYNGEGFNVWEPITAFGKTFSHFIWDEKEKNFYPTIDKDAKFTFTDVTPFPFAHTVDKYKGKILTLSAYSSWVKSNIFDKIFESKDYKENYKGSELIWDVKGKTYLTFLIASGSQDPANNFYMSSDIKLREDQVSFQDSEKYEGYGAGRLNNNPYFKRLKALIFGNEGFTIYEDGGDIYFINTLNSQRWLRFVVPEED
ncbi:MAG: hypothetical protein EZS26_001789 [Candidatus Ordinivivax streblomastigis]|uniref:DUF4302 domain-containing protein n=1 Tax=Candidatus Ordinivivax streblomastigis TaxID=2540710 RepID=A0A5M8P0L3_9BACT|nr:MAG: hypothetical protein EZS26_001789 [Candidatus Ordinivivax streblomastigis]